MEKFGLSKKAAVVSNFCLIGIIHCNFLLYSMIESARQTFMPIQTLDLHRVGCATEINQMSKDKRETIVDYFLFLNKDIFCRLGCFHI